METKKRDYTKFFTYPQTAKFMAEALEPKKGQFILEPSAGNGMLVRAVKELSPNTHIVAVELYEDWRKDLVNCADVVIIKDFLQFESIPKFSGCIANPPFGNGIDLGGHVNKMMELVKSGGRLVILVPDEYELDIPHESYPIENWSKNSDGTTTEIKIISFLNP